MTITREQDREMILNPQRWPLLSLPLKRPGGKTLQGWPETAVLTVPISIMKIKADEPIAIRFGTIFDDLSDAPTRTYQDVDALLDDGWVVD